MKYHQFYFRTKFTLKSCQILNELLRDEMSTLFLFDQKKNKLKVQYIN